MKDQWYCGVDGQQYGPYTWDQLRAMAAEGRIVSETYVRRETDQQWLSAAQVPGLLARKKTVKKTVAAGSASRSDSGAMASINQTAVKSATAKPATATTRVKAAKPANSGAIAAPPVQSAPAAGAIPVGQAVGPVVAPVGVPVGFAINTAPPKPAVATDHDEETPGKKRGNPLLLVGILGSAVLAIAAVGIGVVAWTWSQPADDADAVAQADDPVADSPTSPPAEANPGEANPGGAESNPGELTSSPAAKKSAPKGNSSASEKLPAKSVAAAQKVISSQAKWSNLLRLKEVKINAVSLQVTSIWLSADLAGTRVDPQLPAGQAPPEPAPATTDAAPAEAGDVPAALPAAESTASSAPAQVAKYVFVEVRVANAAPVPRKYSSWNAAAATAAVLASDTGDILAPVPPSATAGVNRLSSVQVQPGQSVFDVLVFEAPLRPFESLKLALAKTSVAEGAKGHFAFEAPLEFMFRKRPPLGGSPAAGAGALGGGPVSANQTPLAGEKGEIPGLLPDKSPPPAEPEKPVAEEKPKVNKPPSREELNKQFEDFDKSPPQDAGKEPAKVPAKTEPAKPPKAAKP